MTNATDKLIAIDDLGKMLGGRSRASIYRDIERLPNFPKPLKVGSSTRFRLSDAQQYIAGLGEGSKIVEAA